MLMAALSVLLGAVTVMVHMLHEDRMHAYAARAVNIFTLCTSIAWNVCQPASKSRAESRVQTLVFCFLY